MGLPERWDCVKNTKFRQVCCETVPGTGEVARFPAETLGTHKDGNTEYNVTSTGSPTATPGHESLTSNLTVR
jgi:hypothetical protein